MRFDEVRLKKICKDAIEQLKLDLTGLKVVTEAASGLYAVTPLIALMADAAEVVCIGKNTAHGKFNEIKGNICRLAEMWNLPQPIITSDRFDERLKNADIITNLGMVRPIDKQLLQIIGSQAVIPYMCEAWEVREGDVDFQVCKDMGIPVMGTDENHPNVGVFDYCGMLAVKMILEAGFEILNNKIAVISSDQFGPVIRSAIIKCGGQAKLYTCNDNYSKMEQENWDSVIVAEYIMNNCILGSKGSINGSKLEKLVKNTCGIIQFAGWNEVKDLLADVVIYPEENLEPNRMARTLAYLGPWPIVLLHTAGLLVGEKMARAKKQKLIGEKFINYVSSNAPAQEILTSW